ncbi:bifunctional diaminohydroxyphosphoribosylaminopyrimidine deaminase/5-amino-6-(5-phosphoribosylamino)uracil reductase RibD [Corynebacterium uterequi]|uniref:Riboflavin biosynthesis protein RibD n=1 Tax=Corynebacterium uterequi TaxID=1072256 RepID=A0A0G3HGZ8_9CORY|nr:bifunctional diaminohydroxyphosphoribosylaminopyrimidine deaminase/5-amino-6-(5-phosphoribosylamino)uracil reductase RibD [Corynebacterium uterequi]AKK11173.1 Riboflavin biosynthesis protein RibD [Corynebacterium uterequi]
MILDAVLARALSLGEAARGTTSPNPPVGAVVVDSDGRIVGEGHTQPPGGPHAEIMALADAGPRARGATAVVTLEPCNHQGRTGPCTQALLSAGIARVIYLTPDPNPKAAGGAAWLRQRGVDVRYHDVEVAALRPWLTSVRLGRPHVTLKVAQTLDGFSAAADGTSQWITGPEARHHVHADRARRDAIVVGTGTALADNPSLTARDVGATRQPRRVVVGTRDITGVASNLVRLGFEQYPSIDEALAALQADGAVDVLVEGGPTLAGAFLRAGKVDALRCYLAPLLLGEGRSIIGGGLAATLSEAVAWRRIAVGEVGEDLVLDFVRKGD